MPAFVVSRYGVLDHWRAFLSPDSPAVRVFSMTPQGRSSPVPTSARSSRRRVLCSLPVLLSSQELDALKGKRRNPATGSYFCSDTRCVEGIYSPPQCLGRPCAVLFSSYFSKSLRVAGVGVRGGLVFTRRVLLSDESSFLMDHVCNMTLLVRVAWLGPHLDTEFVSANFNRSGGRSVLFYHFTPDVLVQPFDLTSVAFPSCADHVEVRPLARSLGLLRSLV